MTGGTGLVGKAIEWNSQHKSYPDTEFFFLSSSDADLRDLAQTTACFAKFKPTHVIHLAARVVSPKKKICFRIWYSSFLFVWFV